MVEIVCTTCGTDEHLRGAPGADGMIEITCVRCGSTWTRDPRPTCPICGGTEMEAAPRLLVEKSRGSQMSIQGVQREFLCRVCDAERLSTSRDRHLPERLPGSE